jgi:hypothetical protein
VQDDVDIDSITVGPIDDLSVDDWLVLGNATEPIECSFGSDELIYAHRIVFREGRPIVAWSWDPLKKRWVYPIYRNWHVPNW